MYEEKYMGKTIKKHFEIQSIMILLLLLHKKENEPYL